MLGVFVGSGRKRHKRRIVVHNIDQISSYWRLTFSLFGSKNKNRESFGRNSKVLANDWWPSNFPSLQKQISPYFSDAVDLWKIFSPYYVFFFQNKSFRPILDVLHSTPVSFFYAQTYSAKAKINFGVFNYWFRLLLLPDAPLIKWCFLKPMNFSIFVLLGSWPVWLHSDLNSLQTLEYDIHKYCMNFSS